MKPDRFLVSCNCSQDKQGYAYIRISTSGWKHNENVWKQNLFSWWQAERWKFMYSAFCCLCCLALWLPHQSPLICFLFVAVIFSSVPSSCQSCLDWFCPFCKGKKGTSQDILCSIDCDCSGRVLPGWGEEEEMWGQSVPLSLCFVLGACCTGATHFFGLHT